MPDTVLAVENASVAYGKGAARCQALRDVSMEFGPGTMTLIMGPSGSGKTTLLSLLGCLLNPDSGRVFIAGEEVSRLGEVERTNVRRRSIGFVFQAFRLFESLSAEENVAVAAQIAGISSKSEQHRLARMLDRMAGAEDGIRDALTRYTTAISGAYYFVPSVEALHHFATAGEE